MDNGHCTGMQRKGRVIASGYNGVELVKSEADGAERDRVLDFLSWRSWLMPTSSSAEPRDVSAFPPLEVDDVRLVRLRGH